MEINEHREKKGKLFANIGLGLGLGLGLGFIARKQEMPFLCQHFVNKTKAVVIGSY